MENSYDVIIVGGGLAGLSLSCLLGQMDGLRVACVDRDLPAQQLAMDERTTAISYGSSQILERAGVWQEMLPHGCPIEDIEILDGDSPVLLQFLSKEVEGKAFGWILPNAIIREILMGQMGRLENVTHIAPVKVKDYAVDAHSASVVLEDGQVLKSALVVGADGRYSSLREFMDVPVRKWNYKQQAVVCFVMHEHSHQNKAVEHFLSGGPFAVLPMKDLPLGQHCSSLVFTEHQGRGGSLMDLSDVEFQKVVADQFPESYGKIEILNNKRMVYPLSLVHAARYIAPRMVLVADAAHGIHPIAGQGLNLGFRDLGALSALIQDAKDKGQDIGSQGILEDYQRKRRPDNMAMVAATDALVRLFSTDFGPVVALRRVGLRAVSRVSRAKQFFMRRAMGE